MHFAPIWHIGAQLAATRIFLEDAGYLVDFLQVVDLAERGGI
jgi:hypothetical protein